MTLKDIDCSRLLYDPKSVDLVKQLKEKIPEFSKYSGKISATKVFSYIILMFDLNSFLWRDILDYYERKRVCAELLEFPKKKNQWSPEAEEILLGNNDQVNAMIVEYVAQFGSPELLQLIANMSLLSSETRKAISSKGNKDTIKIITETGDEIRRLTRIVFHSGEYDEITKARNALYAKAEKERLKLRPEDIVHAFSETGELPEEFNPYGSDYKVEKSKFIGDEEPE